MSSGQPTSSQEVKPAEAPSPEEQRQTELPLPEVQAEAGLLRQANHWYALYLDAEASVAQFRADAAKLQQQLADALEREKRLAGKNLELRFTQPPEVCKRSQEEASVRFPQLRNLEQLLLAKDTELQRLQQDLADRKSDIARLRAEKSAALAERSEIETLRAELRARQGLEELLRATELEVANVRKELKQSLAREDNKSQLVDAKDHQLRQLRLELAEQRELCRQLTKEAEETRLICSERLASVGSQEASHMQLIESLRAENALADMRIQNLENTNMRLRMDLQSYMACCPPETPPASPNSLFTAALLGQETLAWPPKSPRERRLHYPRRLKCTPGITPVDRTFAARYDEQGKLRSFDAIGREV